MGGGGGVPALVVGGPLHWWWGPPRLSLWQALQNAPPGGQTHTASDPPAALWLLGDEGARALRAGLGSGSPRRPSHLGCAPQGAALPLK